jgi:hypothetical protein
MAVCLISFEMAIENVAVCMEKSALTISFAVTPFTRILGSIKPSLCANAMLKLAIDRNLTCVSASVWHLEINSVVKVVLSVHSAAFAA